MAPHYSIVLLKILIYGSGIPDETDAPEYIKVTNVTMAQLKMKRKRANQCMCLYAHHRFWLVIKENFWHIFLILLQPQ